MELLRNFKELNKSDVGKAGGKGASLGEMTAAGIPVPPGFVILSSSFEKFIEETGLSAEIDAILDSVHHEEMHTVENASEKIQALIMAAKMPKDIEKAIVASFKKLGAKYVAVRSSATAEDSASAAWAGQLDSYLNTTGGDLLENVKRCWASLFTPRAIFYRFEQDLHKQKISVAVVVQKMVESEVSGVAFSVHPVTQDRNQLIIEASYGLGEAIVSGQVTPDSYVAEKQPRRIIERMVQAKARGIYRVAGGGNKWVDLPAAKAKRQALSDAQIGQLSDLILRIEKHYGFPCDIEWAFEKGRFYIVQSRPITTLAQPVKETEDGIIENFAKAKWHFIHKRPRSPLFTSLLWEGSHMKTEVDIPFDYCVKKIIYLDTEIAIDEESWEALRVRVGKIARRDPGALLKLFHDNYKINETVEKFAQATQKKDFSPARLKDLWIRYCMLMRRFGAYVLFPIFIEVDLEKELGDAVSKKYGAGAGEVYRVLTTPIKSGVAQEEEMALLKLAVLKQKGRLSHTAIDGHLRKYSWVANNSFNGKFMTAPALQKRIALAARNHPGERLREYTKKMESGKAEFKKYYRAFSSDRRIKGIIDVLQEAIFFRSWRTERYYRNAYYLQDLFAATAKFLKLKTVDDIFYLTIAEIVEAFDDGVGSMPARALIAERKKGYACFGEGDKVLVRSGGKLKAIKEKMTLRVDAKDLGEIQGQTAYPGKVSGRVSLVLTKNDLRRVKDGCVLVSPSTTVDYVPALKKAIAIVTDEGGVLSHASVISRELNIPCVIGTRVATQALKDGDLVEVDADAGTVRILTIPEGRSTISLKEKYHFSDSTWTHKGFHGVLHTFFPVGETGIVMRDFFGDAAAIIIYFFQNDYAHWYWNDNDLTRIREEFLSRLKKDKRYLEKLKAARDTKIKAFDVILKRVDKINLKKLSNEKIAELYDDFYRRYVDEFKYFMVLGDAVSMHADRYLAPEFKKVLGKGFADAFPKLLTPHYFSFIEEEGIARAKLIKAFRKARKLDHKAIERHAKRFFYIHNNYAKGIRLTAADFAKMVREDARMGVEPAKDRREKFLTEKARLIKKYKLSAWHKTLLYIMDEFFEFQDTRKKYVLISNYYQFQFLREAERRGRIPFDSLCYSVYPEFRKALAGTLDKKVLDARREGCVGIHTKDGFEVVSGEPARSAFAFFQKESGDVKEIKGMTASPGVVRGRVKKILKIHDMTKMMKGDILVSSMTRPEMVPVMKLAAAIVTDEGGVTSHAAIVSREMEIPCIIGAKIATQVLRDGDLVEVDADKGVIKILNER